MRHSRSSRPEVNAGSMADIAFLLLIFFLVTAAIPNDQGFIRKLPKLCESPPCDTEINERNLLQIRINEENNLMINNNLTSLDEIQEIIMDFVDNNGDNTCTFCNGKNSPTSSDNPEEAVVSLVINRNSNYEMFIKVQDELAKAYKELRLNYAQNVLGKTELELTKDDIKLLKDVYPFIVSEAELK